MQRTWWMSEAGYQSGLRAEKRLARLVAREAREVAEQEKASDDALTGAMTGLVGLALGCAIIFFLGLATASTGSLDLIGMDSNLAMRDGWTGWRIWAGGLATLVLLVGVGAGIVNRPTQRRGDMYTPAHGTKA